MHLKGINPRLWIGFFLIFIFLVILAPFFLQWGYRTRLLHTVGIGSTRAEYINTLLAGKLGQGIPHPGYTFWRPIQFHGFIYTIDAFPTWDDTGHLSGYHLYSRVSLRGHVYYLSHPEGSPLYGLR